MDAAGVFVFVEPVDDLAGGHGRVVAVQQEDVQVVGLQGGQAALDIGLHHLGRDPPGHVRPGMAALGDDDDFVAIAAAGQPAADGALALRFAVASRVDGGGVDGVPAVVEPLVEEGVAEDVVGVVEVLGPEHHLREGALCSGDFDVSHRRWVPIAPRITGRSRASECRRRSIRCRRRRPRRGPRRRSRRRPGRWPGRAG